MTRSDMLQTAIFILVLECIIAVPLVFVLLMGLAGWTAAQ